MTEHYYSAKPSAKSEPRDVDAVVRGVTIHMTTDAGVFAKRGLDRATEILLNQVTLKEPAVVVDLGCGYGPVTAVLAKLYPGSRFVMLDVNERAIELARENTKMYGDRIEVYQSDGFSAVSNLSCDDVILNPPIRAGKVVVYRLFEEACEHLTDSGSLWVVIQKKHGANSALVHLQNLFPTVETVYKKSGYFVYRCCKNTVDENVKL